MSALTYDPPQPQVGDSELTLDHKTAVNISNLANGSQFSHIAAKATTLVKTGDGYLHSVVINTKGATGNNANIFDGIDNSGTLIAVLDLTQGPATIFYNLAFAVGLTVVTDNGTQADITVIYR